MTAKLSAEELEQIWALLDGIQPGSWDIIYERRSAAFRALARAVKGGAHD